jgi:hypothetical protein
MAGSPLRGYEGRLGKFGADLRKYVYARAIFAKKTIKVVFIFFFSLGFFGNLGVRKQRRST